VAPSTLSPELYVPLSKGPVSNGTILITPTFTSLAYISIINSILSKKALSYTHIDAEIEKLKKQKGEFKNKYIKV
jgi:hypothetical protein